MEKAAYCILILCGILSQGICNVSEENSENSSDLLIREKRVVGGAHNNIENTPYLVNVLENGNSHCHATLLTADVAISSATCFKNHNIQNMRIKSHSTGGAKLHEIVRVNFLNPNYNPAYPTVKNLALVRFALPINFRMSFNRPIPIYSGNLTLDHSPLFVVSWGTPRKIRGRMVEPETLRFLSVIVISFEYCQSIYPNVVQVENICTSATVAGEYCEPKDTGAPLIIDNHLLGIFVYRNFCDLPNPNVFMNFLDHNIRRWIHEQIPSLRLL